MSLELVVRAVCSFVLGNSVSSGPVEGSSNLTKLPTGRLLGAIFPVPTRTSLPPRIPLFLRASR